MLIGVVVVVAGVLLPASPLRAQCVQEDEDRAFALSAESRARYGQGRFEETIRLLDRAYATCPVPVLLYNLARTHEANGNLEAAIDAYARFLEAAPDTPDRPGIERRIETLREQLAARAAQPPASASPWPWVVLSTGALTLVAGVVLGAVSEAAEADAQSDMVHLRKAELAEQASDYALAANAAFVAGAALAVAGSIWGVIDLLATADDGPSAVSLALAPGALTVALAGRF